MRLLALRLVALALPVPLAAWASVRLAEHAAHVAAVELERAVAPMVVKADAPPPALPAANEQTTVDVAPASAHPARRHRIVHGIRVSAARVLALANAGARPGGHYVPSDGVRPAGLALSGVGALGIGMRDGDVLTNAGGRAATSASVVIGVVIAARAAHAPEIDGVFWRAGEPWQLVVEQPYVPWQRPSNGRTIAKAHGRVGKKEGGPGRVLRDPGRPALPRAHRR